MIYPSLDYLTYFSDVFGIESRVGKWVEFLKHKSPENLLHGAAPALVCSLGALATAGRFGPAGFTSTGGLWVPPRFAPFLHQPSGMQTLEPNSLLW